MTWDVTVVSTLADSYLHVTSHSAGSAEETDSVRNETKYSSLPSDYIFQPIAFKNLGPLSCTFLQGYQKFEVTPLVMRSVITVNTQTFVGCMHNTVVENCRSTKTSITVTSMRELTSSKRGPTDDSEFVSASFCIN